MNDLSFRDYANTIDSLQRIAYDNKDTVEFKRLLKEFDCNFQKLPKRQKKEFNNFYQSAYYNLACTYALVGDIDQSIKSLRKAVDLGYVNYYHVIEDPDFNALREQHDYHVLIEKLRNVGDYIYMLKKADAYNNEDKRKLPKFSYEDSNSEYLVNLRKFLNLDSVVGTGNEVSRIINIMHWVHDNISHDGSISNPPKYDALNLISICKKEKRGLNCRGLATVLNECYLAMGYQSRLVTCMPKDSLGVDDDCHVINAVFSKKLNKWLWMDPTNDAYIMNENGELLSIQEVRERLIDNRTLIVNPDANWNHKSSTIKENYLDYYMAKNLYKFECPVVSSSNLEKREVGKILEYIELLPLEYFEQKPDRTVSGKQSKETVFVRYKTNDPSKFWAAP